MFTSAEDGAILADDFVFRASQGMTYAVVSASHGDPYLLRVYDNLGNVIAIDHGGLDYGYDYVQFQAPYSGYYYLTASWNQGSSSDARKVFLGVYEDLDLGVRENVVTGTSANDRLLGSAIDDVVYALDGTDTFVLGRQREHYVVTVADKLITITDGLSGVDTLFDVEKIKFFDSIVSFETTGIAPQAYRLYQAAFGRTPDADGLGYWIAQMEKGTGITEVAAAFTSSKEFIDRYGAGASNSQILSGVYQNVLNRTPDKEGFDYWLGALNGKTITVTDMLVAFSDSYENQVQVIGALQAGFEYSI